MDVARWAIMLLATAAGAAQAQGKLGTYEGTVKITGTEETRHRTITYQAEVKIAMPMTDATMAEVGDVGKPSATATFKQFELSERNASPDSDGKITSWKCTLAAPFTTPMTAQGVLNVDAAAKKHSLFIALVGTKSMPLACVNSRSGPYKTTRGVSLSFGTNEPGAVPYVELPVADTARLAAKHRFVPAGPAARGEKIVLDQEWDFALRR